MLAPEIIESNYFLHFYMKTVECVTRTRRTEKIQMFARMLSAGMTKGAPGKLDEYEELMDVFFDLGYREFGALSLLRRFELEHAGREHSDELKRILAYWPDFKAKVAEVLDIREIEFDALMARLQRTRLFLASTDSFFDRNPGFGTTTPQFAKLCRLVAKDSK